jgi:formylglycine-generating enzyme required for sulfatase activity
MKKLIPLILLISLLVATGCFASEKRMPENASLGDTWTRPDDGVVMVYVPPGEFQMGSDDEAVDDALQWCDQYWGNCEREWIEVEQPVHMVELDGFWIGQTEISNDQYRQCVESGACEAPACWSGPQFNAPDQPVVCMTWAQAQVYCEWVGGRLPTEAEWEYAARGTEEPLFPWGDTFDGSRLNYCDATCGRARADNAWDDGLYYTASVGSYPTGASWCGALDMAGNVSEWVMDRYGDYSLEQQVNPTGPLTGQLRTIRGGSWFLTRVEARGTWREGLPADRWFDDLGFRCVLSAPEN